MEAAPLLVALLVFLALVAIGLASPCGHHAAGPRKAAGPRQAAGPRRVAARGPSTGGATAAPPSPQNWQRGGLGLSYPYNHLFSEEEKGGALHSSEEVDPLITGGLYSAARAAGRGRRWVYSGRTADGGTLGMREFSSGVSGQPGVDVGLLGMRQYALDRSGDVFDDGVPENWRIPATPLNWYASRRDDHYDVAGAAPAAPGGVRAIQEEDHDLLTN